MSDNPCGHDARFGLFGLPKEANGCLACHVEHIAAENATLRADIATTQAEFEKRGEFWAEDRARLAEAERFIEELNDESAEDWRTRKYVVIQMTEETWDKLRSWKPSDSTASQPSAVRDPLIVAVQQIMARLADLLDDDQFNNISRIALDAGVPYPPLRAADNGTQPSAARPLSEWREDDGPVLWWAFPVNEPPYCGTPIDTEWPCYHTHWTRIEVPRTASNGEPGHG